MTRIPLGRGTARSAEARVGLLRRSTSGWAMRVGVELNLEERLEDRLYVSVCLSPYDSLPTVEGVEVQLVDLGGAEVSPKVILPISGKLQSPIMASVELRAVEGTIPAGSRVMCWAWVDGEQLHASVPGDPYKRFRDWMLGSDVVVRVSEDAWFDELSPEERERLVARMPWVAEPTRRAEVLGVIESVAEAPSASTLEAELGLDQDAAEWLHELLSEEE